MQSFATQSGGLGELRDPAARGYDVSQAKQERFVRFIETIGKIQPGLHRVCEQLNPIVTVAAGTHVDRNNPRVLVRTHHPM
jgi:hypothetical protein